MATAVALALAGAASPHSLTVPFFKDNGGDVQNASPGTGSAAFITVRNTRDEPVTMFLVYAQSDPQGNVVLQPAVAYTVEANTVLNFRPVQDDPVEGIGQGVPNMMPGLGDFGSLSIYWVGGAEMKNALIGKYREFTSSRDMMYVLIGN